MVEKKKSEESEEIKTKTFFTFNADIFRIIFSEEDFLLEFSQFPPDDDGYCPKVRIYIPPQLSKKIIDSIKSAIKDFEKEYGEMDT